MSVWQWIWWVPGMLLSGLGVIGIRTHWRGEHTFFVTAMPTWWLWGRWTWRGWIRAAPTLGVAFMVMFVCMPFMLLLPTRSVGQIIALALAVGGLAIALLIWLTVLVFGRPRFVIPPHLRPGAE